MIYALMAQEDMESINYYQWGCKRVVEAQAQPEDLISAYPPASSLTGATTVLMNSSFRKLPRTL